MTSFRHLMRYLWYRLRGYYASEDGINLLYYVLKVVKTGYYGQCGDEPELEETLREFGQDRQITNRREVAIYFQEALTYVISPWHYRAIQEDVDEWIDNHSFLTIKENFDFGKEV